VEEYHKEMEVILMKAKIEESMEAAMTRFIHGLGIFKMWWNFMTTTTPSKT